MNVIDEEILSEPAGTFTDLANEIENANDELNLTSDYIYSSDDSGYNGITINKKITINGNGFTINGNNNSRAFYINHTDVILNNITFVDCKLASTSQSEGDHGGAIYWNGDYGILSNCNFINCSVSTTYLDASASPSGGAIFWRGFNGTLNKCSFDNCSASSFGLHVFDAKSTPTGGAILWRGANGTLNDCSFENCFVSSIYTALSGGSIFWNADNGTLNNCSFKNGYAAAGPNKNSGDGGVIRWYGSYGSLNGCTFENNHAKQDGGVLYWNGARCSLNNCSFINSSAGQQGGAIYWDASEGTLNGCSFVNSSAELSGGAITWNREKGTLRNCSFVNSRAEYSGGCIRVTDDFFSIYDSKFVNSTGYSQEGGAIQGDGNHALIYNCSFENCTLIPKNYESNDGGAIRYEGFNCTISHCSFIKNNATFAGAIMLDGDNGTVSYCYFVNNTSKYDGGAVYLSGTNGKIFDCVFEENTGHYGGAIKMSSGYGSISNCEFVNNHAGYQGGAISFTGSNGVVYNCSFINNSADYQGGAIYWDGADNTVNYNIFINNGDEIYYERASGMNTNYNWFGNNATNYAQQPNIPNCNIWLFLNATADESSLLISQPEIIFRLYVYDPNLHEITEFEDSLKPINLTITAANGNVNNTQVDLGECIKFTPSDVGACSVTAKIESYAYTYEFDIAKMNPEMEIENQEIPYGNNVNITLIYNTNATGKVNITLNGKKYTQTFTDVDLNNIISLGDVLPDEYDVIIKYSGDEKFFNATLYATLIVNKLDANLAYESMTIPYSENTIITLTYNDTATGKVNITLNGKKYNLTFTDVDLNKTIALVNVLPDEYNVTVLYSGDDKFLNATANATLTVNKLDTNIICDSITTAYNSDDYLIITLKDINGEPVNDVTLTVDFNGSIDNYTTENGTVKIPVKGLAPGNYTAMITFNETSIYLGSNATANVTVLKASAEMSSDGLTTVYQVHKYLNVTLKDADGNPITNDYVNITINGVTYNCKLDENGNAELIIRLNAGTYKATITFENGNYNKTTITTKVVVKKSTPKLTAKKKTFKKSKKVKKYTVTLKNNVGKVMKKAKLTMKVKGKTYKATTNSKGKATFKITKLTKKGTFKAKITYKGNKNYNRLIKTVKIKIK